MRKYLEILFGVGLVLVAMTATSLAAGAVPASDDQGLELAKSAFDSIMAGHYVAGAAGALVLALAMFKRYAPGRAGELANTDAGGSLLALGMAFAGGIAMATMSGKGWGGLSSGVLIASLKVAVTAAGGYAIIKKLVVDPLMSSAWYKDKAPSWLKAIMTVAMFAFTRKDVTKEATEAGDKAVADSPAGGADAVAGKPTEL